LETILLRFLGRSLPLAGMVWQHLTGQSRMLALLQSSLKPKYKG
jgi:hypothetical protein